jgi:riboflavin biosynthesis pyrimidine reductase
MRIYVTKGERNAVKTVTFVCEDSDEHAAIVVGLQRLARDDESVLQEVGARLHNQILDAAKADALADGKPVGPLIDLLRVPRRRN